MNIMKICFILIATMVGAGFATGRELLSFFGGLGKMAIPSFAISMILLAICMFAILNIIKKTNASTYKEFLQQIFGKKIGSIVEIFNTSFLFVIFSNMLAGGDFAMQGVLNSENNIFLLIVILGLAFGKTIAINLNALLCPFLIIGLLFISIYINASPVFNGGKATLSALSYMSYNFIGMVSIFYAIRNLITDKKMMLQSSIFSSVFIFIIGVLMLLPIVNSFDTLINYPIPITNLISDKTISFAYTMLLLIAIYTTAIGNGFALVDVIKNKFKLNHIVTLTFIILGAIIFSKLGFSTIVDYIYPAFGYIGILECLFILFRSIDK